MSTLAAEARSYERAPIQAGWRLNATLCFWIAGLIAYGGAAAYFACGPFLDQTSRDLWQHLAALRVLIHDPAHPLNPFIPTADISRHFHPYWVSIAWIARLAGWNEWQAIAFGGYLTAGVLLSGIYAFGRTFYRDPWGPTALLVSMVFGWLIATSHTGSHSMGTLVEGIAYPAALLIGLSFLLWALVIQALVNSRWAIAIAPLTALMFATHQLGAGIGLIGAGCFIAFSPDGSLRNRVVAAASLAIGLAAASCWPYFNPFELIVGTGNAKWEGGLNFYEPIQLVAVTVPQVVGLLGLLTREFASRARPVLIAFIVFALLFTGGLFGVMIATRFVMPAVLMLHIGLGALLLRLARRWQTYTKRRQLTIFAIGFLLTDFGLTLNYIYFEEVARHFGKRGNVYLAARALTADVPDNEPIAGYDVAIWPVVATGQRAISIPWPEPGIPDLGERQQLVRRLFDPRLSRDQRVALARSSGVRVLIMDNAGLPRRDMPPLLVETLTKQSIRHSRAGTLLRFDLY